MSQLLTQPFRSLKRRLEQDLHELQEYSKVAKGDEESLVADLDNSKQLLAEYPLSA